MSYCSTLGMLEIGVVVSSILFGILTMQIYFYHKNFSEDPPWIKLGLVDGIWFIELIHTVCIAHEVYFYSVLHFGDTSTFNGWPVSFAIAAICHGVVTVLVQGFLTYRISRFTGHLYIILILISCYSVMMIAELVFNIVIGVEIATIARQSFISYRQEWQWLILTVLIMRAALDVLISGTLVYYLTYHRNKAYKNTIAVIDKLILWTIDSSYKHLTASVYNNPRKLQAFLTQEMQIDAWVFLYMILPKIFSNTLLANMQTTVVPMSHDVMSDIHINGGMLFTLDTENRSRTTNAPGKQCFPRRLSSDEVREQTVIA
ncbi:hypothetical protein EV359DRAFT_63545 [Lentinula novae-zelandiae]|nr:hypothetical protein EV359DRAFT_63545 [Lentinula novae-zelandiae]